MLLLGDCLDLMGEIPDGSVDMVLADLPYGQSACAWDAVIPFVPLWDHYRRVLNPTGAVVLTASQPFTSALVMSNPKWFKYALVWEKENGSNFLNARHQPLKVHEDILVFSAAPASYSPNRAMSYYPQKTAGTPRKAAKRYAGLHQYRGAPVVTLENTGTRHPRSVMRFKTERGLHGTQKPVALLEYLIRTYTGEGETVLDNAMGSGSTGVACTNTGRRFIGIERDPDYFAAAQVRIETPQLEAAD